VANRVVETWARTLKNESDDIYAKMLERIPDLQRFVERMAQPAHDGFRPFVNPAFVNKSGQGYDDIETAQIANLKRSYEKYADKLAFLFETVDGVTAKRFKDLVDRMKQAYGKGVTERVLPFTGTKIEGRGCAPIAGYWLVNDLRVNDYLRASDHVLEGGPFRVCTLQVAPSFKAALMGRLMQAGASIVKAENNPLTIADQNGRINHLVQSNVDPGLGLIPFATGALSHVDYILEDNQLFLDVQVSQI
jgi:hypothetical protein